MIVLDERLSTLAELIGKVDTLYDIGSNHGRLPAAMLQSGSCRQACLTDISEKALSRARLVLEKEKLLEKVSFRVTDGLTGIEPTEKDGIVISGMGAQVIVHILENETPKAPLALQANLDVPYLRRWLCENGYTIEKEKICRAAGRFYVCLLCRYTGTIVQLDETAAYLGNLQSDPLYKAYYAWRLQIAQKAFDGAIKGNDTSVPAQLEKEIRLCRSVFGEAEE